MQFRSGNASIRPRASRRRRTATANGRSAKLARIGTLCSTIAWLACACQVSEAAVNQPLPNDAAGRPVYSPGYALLPMLKEP
jgi:hypothetical protein